MTFYNSVHSLKADFGFESQFVGLANFAELLAEDVIFRRAIVNTLVWGVAAALLEIRWAWPWRSASTSGSHCTACSGAVVHAGAHVVSGGGHHWLWYFNYDWGGSTRC